MDQQLVSAWLQLAPGTWPPDHYSLLGLRPGEADVARIEQQVYERMEIVRRYQLTHPEVATEAMNRLAQALVCLTDAAAKKAYDAALFPAQFGFRTEAGLPATSDESVHVDPLTRLRGLISSREANGHSKADRVAPPEFLKGEEVGRSTPFGESGPAGQHDRGRREDVSRPTEILYHPAAGIEPREANWRTSPPAAQIPRPASFTPAYVPPFVHLTQANEELIETVKHGTPHGSAEPPQGAVDSPENALPAGGGPFLPAPPVVPSGRLRDKRALFARITRLRQLLWAWEQAGKFLKSDPPRIVNCPADAVELMAHMHAIRQLLSAPPMLLGYAGEAGYHVQTLARQEDIVPRLKKLTPPQRESLARDWQAGHDLLLENRRILRQELRELRSRGFFRRAAHLVGAAVAENVGLILFLLAVVALNLAFQDEYPELRSSRFQEAILVLTVAGGRLLWWWHSYRPLKARLHAPGPLERRKPMLGKQQPQSSGAKA